MFKGIRIENYRGIRRCEIADVSQINLFFGKNNCGKSSVLESIFLLTGQSNPSLPIIANKIRGIEAISESVVKLDFYGADPENRIRIVADGDPSRELQIELIRSKSHNINLSELDLGKSNAAKHYYGIKMSYRLNGNSVIYTSELITSDNNEDKADVHIDKRYKESLIAQYMPSNYLNDDISVIVKNLSKIIQNKQENDIIDILRIIEPRLVGIQIVGSNIMVDIGLEQRLPVNVLGDGIRKLLSVIVALSECANGVLIIDEIDNGLHYSVMSRLWRAIIYSAKKNNVQLFVSTHNIDLLKGLTNALEESDDQMMVCAYKLIRKEDDEIASVRYNYENMAYAIEQEIEMR